MGAAQAMKTELLSKFNPLSRTFCPPAAFHMIVCSALLWWGISCRLAFAADATIGTLASADASVQIEARDTQLKLLALKSVRCGWNWAAGNELPLIKSVEVNGES